MAVTLALETMRGGVLASDTAGTIFPMGKELPVAVAVASPKGFQIEWNTLFEEFSNQFIETEQYEFEDYVSALLQRISETIGIFPKGIDAACNLTVLGYGARDLFPSYHSFTFWMDESGGVNELSGETQKGKLGPKVEPFLLCRNVGDCGYFTTLRKRLLTLLTLNVDELIDVAGKFIDVAGVRLFLEGKQSEMTSVKEISIVVRAEGYRKILPSSQVRI